MSAFSVRSSSVHELFLPDHFPSNWGQSKVVGYSERAAIGHPFCFLGNVTLTPISRGLTVNGRLADIVLDIRVPAGTEELLKSLIAYGQQKGITVQIKGYL